MQFLFPEKRSETCTCSRFALRRGKRNGGCMDCWFKFRHLEEIWRDDRITLFHPYSRHGLWVVWGDSGDERNIVLCGRLAVNWYPSGATALGLRPNSTFGSWGVDLGRLVIRWLPNQRRIPIERWEERAHV